MINENLLCDLKDTLKSITDIVSGENPFMSEHLFILKILALQSVLTEVLEDQTRQIMKTQLRKPDE